uniref:Ig-like domain-containing protein n=1 Tax=Cyprinus carpio carpio TaxID=630221 RepID=A0A9J8CPT8_CYPCA
LHLGLYQTRHRHHPCHCVQLWKGLHFVITLTVPVTKPYIVMSDSSPVEGTSVTMRCGLENGTGPINYIWEQESRESQLTTVAEIYDDNQLNVTDVNRNHTGWYRCIASNQVNQQRSDRQNLMHHIPQINVSPYSVTERGYSALERETVSLLCQASSNPPSQYVWFYNNSQVYAGPQYTINRILRMHTGHYACLAQNTYLNTLKKGQEALYCFVITPQSPLHALNVHLFLTYWGTNNPTDTVY